MDLAAIQAALTDARLDGWLFYDHHYRDSLAYRILGLPEGLNVTRRWYFYVPASGEPKKLVHRIESGRLDALTGPKTEYSSWQELEAGIAAMLAGQTKIAMQYSPRNAIMYVALADAGTIELLRSLGKEIVSSANLISQFEAVLTAAQIATHFAAGEKIDRILEAGFKEIGDRVRNGGTHEQAIVEFLQEGMRREGLVWDHGTNVSCGPNSADSHYEPSPERSRPINTGDFVLIDIWARLDQPGSCFYDITWTGVVGREPTEREQQIFETVRDARDAACELVTAEFAMGNPIAGWQADDASRAVIRAAGLAEFFTHRTGHNIGNTLHGSGAHLDNLETHDERWLLPNTCFSVEPGLYFPGEFGLRSEVNMIARVGKAEITGRIQRELVRI
jgi:Xaa-Pro aminopeptidase